MTIDKITKFSDVISPINKIDEIIDAVNNLDTEIDNLDFNEFTGATSTSNGIKGMVPAPTKEEVNKYLGADGTWKDVPRKLSTYTNDAGLAYESDLPTKISDLQDDVNYIVDTDIMNGATISSNGLSGLVPQPTSGYLNRFLAVDGTWKEVNDLGTDCTYAGIKNTEFGGRNLGTITSTTQAQDFIGDYEVSSGKFTHLKLGDYVKIQDGTYDGNWMIAGFDTKYLKGWLVDGSDATQWITQHHLTMIPRVPLFNAQMNSTNTTTGGYASSAMHTSTLPTVVSNLQKVLGSHLLKQYVLLSTSINTSATNMWGTAGGASNNWEWKEAYAVLPSEVEIYGSTIWSSSGYDVGEACMKLPVFNFINHIEYSRWNFWLRGVASAALFCFAYGDGVAYAWGASGSSGVRPLICVG